MILVTLRRRRFNGETSQTILRLCPSSVRTVTDLSRLGRSFLTLRLNWASVESTASCSRRRVCFCSTVDQLRRSSPFLSWFGRQQSPSHIDPRTMPRLSEHPRRREPCWRFRDLWVTTVHPASLNVSRSPGGELSPNKNRCQSSPVGVSRRPLRSNSLLRWCLLLRAYPAPGR